MILFSIIVPVYNSEKYLEVCIESIINQTYEEFELILVNDGSTDESPYICDKYNSSDDRIRVIHKKNGGVSSARNVGIDESKGQYLIFVDSDDYIEKNLLKEMNIALNKYEIESIVHTINLQKNNYKKDQKKSENRYIIHNDEIASYMPEFIKKRYINSPCNKLYSKSLIEKNNIRFNEKISIGEDALFNYYYFENLKEYIVIDEVLYYYRDNNSSLTNTYDSRKIDMLMYVNDRLQEMIEPNTNFSKCKSAANYIRIKGIYSSLFDIINAKISKEDKDILYSKIFQNNKKFNLKEIDEISFKILAIVVNLENKFILDKFSKLIYKVLKLFK